MAIVTIYRVHGRNETYVDIDDNQLVPFFRSGKCQQALDRSPRALAVEAWYVDGERQKHTRIIPSDSRMDIETTFRLIESLQDMRIGV